MKRIVVVGQGYQAGKAVKMAGKIHPKADLVWISDFEERKYPLSLLSMLLKSGAGISQWSRAGARMKVDFEKYQRSVNLFPRKVKKIRFDIETSEVSFLTGMGKVSHAFDKALIFPPGVVEYPEDLPEDIQEKHYLWPDDHCVRYMADNWKDIRNPVVVGSDMTLVQALVQSEKKPVWIRTANLFTGQVQFFLDQQLLRLGVKIIHQAPDSSPWEALRKEMRDNRDRGPVFICGQISADRVLLEEYGLKKDIIEHPDARKDYKGSVVCMDVPGPEGLSSIRRSPEAQAGRALKVTEAALAGDEELLPAGEAMFWNLGGLSAAKTGLDPDLAHEKGHTPEFALIHGLHGISGDKPYVLNMFMDRPTRKIIGLEAVGEKAHEWINLGAGLIRQGATVRDAPDLDIIWPDLSVNPFIRCARRLANKLSPGILGITPDELQQSAGEGAVFFLLDVREHDEFALGRVPGAENIPLNQLKKKAMQIPRFTPIVVYSHCSGRAYEGAKLLRTLGAKQLYVLDGGYGLYTLEKDLTPVSISHCKNPGPCPVC
jgi:rhodanese-related sulfurtransferase